MEVSGQLHVLINFPQGKVLLVPIGQEAGCIITFEVYGGLFYIVSRKYK
jgi:hypothetical protein